MKMKDGCPFCKCKDGKTIKIGLVCAFRCARCGAQGPAKDSAPDAFWAFHTKIPDRRKHSITYEGPGKRRGDKTAAAFVSGLEVYES